jgi:hypothetical protein
MNVFASKSRAINYTAKLKLPLTRLENQFFVISENLFMAISKRKKRKIIVNQNIFYWIHKSHKNFLRLIVMTDEKSNSRLICDFEALDPWLNFKEIVENRIEHEDKLLIITPSLVRQIIEVALMSGWKPFEKCGDFILKDIEKKIDINFGNETISNLKSEFQNLKSKI